MYLKTYELHHHHPHHSSKQVGTTSDRTLTYHVFNSTGKLITPDIGGCWHWHLSLLRLQFIMIHVTIAGTKVMKKTWCTYMVILVCCLHAGYACLPKRPGNFCPCETHEDCQLFTPDTAGDKFFKDKAKCDMEAKKCVNVYNEGGCEVTNFLAKQKSIYQAVEALQSS